MSNRRSAGHKEEALLPKISIKLLLGDRYESHRKELLAREKRVTNYHDTIDQYLLLDPATQPPIILEADGTIYDGAHRIAVSIIRGEEEIEFVYRS